LICSTLTLESVCTQDSQCGNTTPLCENNVCIYFECILLEGWTENVCSETVCTGCTNNDYSNCTSCITYSEPCSDGYYQCPEGTYCNQDKGDCSTNDSGCSQNDQCVSGACIEEEYGNMMCSSCQDYGYYCNSDGDCCSSYCDYDSGMCSLMENGESCSGNEQCQSQMCDANELCCAVNGQPSTGAQSQAQYNCCSGYQYDGICGAANGTAVPDASYCQSGNYANGKCCALNGQYSDNNADNCCNPYQENGICGYANDNACCGNGGCASNFCNNIPDNCGGNTTGTCAGVSTGGACWTSAQCSSNSPNTCEGVVVTGEYYSKSGTCQPS
jgi:hypothetical protein